MTEKIVIVAGPTATGKTGVAISLARAHDAEVVSADSMQVYRGFDIGTAKPDMEEREGVAHHLIDVADPDEPFDTERFMRSADEAIADIRGRGKRVIVAGGTGLYLRALLHGLQEGPKPDPDLRKRLLDRASMEGWPKLHQELETVDPDTAKRLHPNDGVRIVRALEVVLASGVPMSTWHREHRFRPHRYEALFLVLNRPREALVDRIHRRADRMMKQGFLEEVRNLLEGGVGPDLKPMQGLGYRRLCQHVNGELSLDEAVEKIKIDTRRFAKRQVTWFKKEPDVLWRSSDYGRINEAVCAFWS